MKPEAARSCFAITAPGFESVTRRELVGLGLVPGTDEPGGVTFEADSSGIFRANLELRTASRVLVRVASFRATAFHELERLARRVEWTRFVPEGARTGVRVTCHKSRLYHSDAVAQRIREAVLRAVPSAKLDEGAPEDEDADSTDAEPAAAELFVRLLHDQCTVSVDSSGSLLHRRGYRLAATRAPVRETLAAGVLLSLGYDGTVPLLDPMCGSGTFSIEAALLARRIAPGLERTFACETWPGAPTDAFGRLRDEARARVLPRAPARIEGSDRDPGAVTAARANAERAGVTGDVSFEVRPLAELPAHDPGGLCVVNPPYGERLGEKGPLARLYRELGDVTRARLPGWSIGVVSSDTRLDAETRFALETRVRFKNGGIAVRLSCAKT